MKLPKINLGRGTEGHAQAPPTQSHLPRRWDVFISHAGEDKEGVAAPLTKLLEYAHLRVWLDAGELAVNDDLIQRITEGLDNCHIGVVIISSNFIRKKFTNYELKHLLKLEIEERKPTILVMHGLTYGDIEKAYPDVANRIMLDTKDGLESVARKIIKYVTADVSAPINIQTPLPMRFEEVIKTSAPDQIAEFLRSYPDIILSTALGGHGAYLDPSISQVAACPSITVGRLLNTLGDKEAHCLILGNPRLGSHSQPSFPSEMTTICSKARKWRQHRKHRQVEREHPQLSMEFGERHESFDVRPARHIQLYVVVGRRELVDDEIKELIIRLSDENENLSVRTYDWLLDAARTLWLAKSGG